MPDSPIKRYSREHRLTYKEIAEKVREVNGTRGPATSHIAGYACGSKKMGPEMADRIHRAFPMLSREEMIYWTPRGDENITQ